MDLGSDYMPEDDKVTGPMCEICGHSTNSVYELWIKRKSLRGQFEMVKTYRCATHYFEQLENDCEDETPPPPDEEEGFSLGDLLGPPDGDGDDEDEDEDWDGQNKLRQLKRKCNVDRIGQSFG